MINFLKAFNVLGFAYSAEYVEHVQICHCLDRLSMLC